MSEVNATETAAVEVPAQSIESLWASVKTTVDSAEEDSKNHGSNAAAALRFRKALRSLSKAAHACAREVLKADKARRLEKKKSSTSRVRAEPSKALRTKRQ
jgi:hypothetical protein